MRWNPTAVDVLSCAPKEASQRHRSDSGGPIIEREWRKSLCWTQPREGYRSPLDIAGNTCAPAENSPVSDEDLTVLTGLGLIEVRDEGPVLTQAGIAVLNG